MSSISFASTHASQTKPADMLATCCSSCHGNGVEHS